MFSHNLFRYQTWADLNSSGGEIKTIYSSKWHFHIHTFHSRNIGPIPYMMLCKYFTFLKTEKFGFLKHTWPQRFGSRILDLCVVEILELRVTLTSPHLHKKGLEKNACHISKKYQHYYWIYSYPLQGLSFLHCQMEARKLPDKAKRGSFRLYGWELIWKSAIQPDILNHKQYI